MWYYAYRRVGYKEIGYMKNYYAEIVFDNGKVKKIDCGENVLRAMDEQGKYVRKKGVKVAQVKYFALP